MPITAQEEATIRTLITNVNTEDNKILEAREDVYALLRLHTFINSNSIEDAILAGAKLKAKTAAQEIVTLLT